MATIDQLIQAHKGNRTWTQITAILDAAHEDGITPATLSRAILQRLGKTGYVPQRVDADTVTALAYALGVSREQVWAAYGESMGIDLKRWESDFIAVAPTGLRELKPEALAHVVKVARDLIEDARVRAALAGQPTHPAPEAAIPPAPRRPARKAVSAAKVPAKKAPPSSRRRSAT